MKTLVFFSLLLLAAQVRAQTPAHAPTGLNKIATLVDLSSGSIVASTPAHPKFVTNKTFNHFAAKRQAYYLSGLNNLSLFKDFAIADVTEGILQVGHNFTPQKEDDLTNSVFTVAVQSNIAHNVANLLAKDKLANDLGLPLSYTFFFATHAGLDSTDVDTLEMQRAFQFRLLRNKTIAELQLLQAAATSNSAVDTVGRPLARKEALAKAEKEFYDSELAMFEKQYPSFYTSWVRLQGFVPLSSSAYQVAPANSMSFQEANTRKWSAGVSIGHVSENTWRWGAIFINGSARVAYTNAIEQQADRIKGYTQYALLNSPTPTQLYYNGDGTKVYVGDLDKQWTVPLQLQFIYLLPSRADTKVGLDIQVERYALNYTKTNFLLGIPVFLKGKEDKGVNVEAQFRWRDTDKKVLGSDRFTVGLSVALPFGSIVK
ncbi:hypothetical protein FNT36_24700 [Hymenobacter setariae]|jgi:hypothetical protein|uniref:DUF5723 domain-containing protein n=1 Tax=Hymenobacter setariae TaxID=2594794 RepID=A0A558BKM4_9BACT|nr:hypothetical protein [Hymenobacter setariae]TVT37065.1 hypothetical protein FNT36_24700 [Hymenobacter setariae]